MVQCPTQAVVGNFKRRDKMSSLDSWFSQMEKMGQADTIMEFEGQWMTPRQYYNMKKGR